MCDKCKVPESVEHYLFDCDKYEEERKELEESVEEKSESVIKMKKK